MRTFVIFALLAAFHLKCQGEAILTQPYSLSIGSAIVSSNALFGFGVREYPPEPIGSGPFVFDGLLISTQDVGRVFTIASSSNDPEYDLVRARLTDGFDDQIDVAFGLFCSNCGLPHAFGTEEFYLFGGVPRAGPDLIGYYIQGLKLRIDSLTIQSPGGDPNHNGIWTDMNGQVTLIIDAVLLPVLTAPTYSKNGH